MARSRIHIRRDVIRRDQRDGTVNYALHVETVGRRPRAGLYVTIDGPSMIIYRPHAPLRGGARAWVETEAPVTVHRREP